MAKTLSPEEAQLLAAIEALLVDGENSISIPLTALNQGIAQLSGDSSKAILKIQSKLLRDMDAENVANENALEAISTSILSPLQDWQIQNNLLLTQLAAAAGLTQPGDPLEAALVNQVAEEPQLAMSAALLIALRDAMPHLANLVEVLKEIRDRMPGFPAHIPGEPEAIAPAEQLPLPSSDYIWNFGKGDNGNS